MNIISRKFVQETTVDQLCVAPENLRAGEGRDDQIAHLGLTLLAGQIQPLLVRAGTGKKEKAFAVLDGRRRFFAFQDMVKAGTLPANHKIHYVLCETPQEIAAATVVANAERLEVSKADCLLAIHKMSQDFKTPEEIGKVLGLEIREVRQMLKLGGSDIRFLKAYKKGNIDLVTLRKVARLTEADAIDRLAAKAAKGHVSPWEVDSSQGPVGAYTAETNLVQMISLDDYTAAGGRIEQDLFGEHPDQLLDGDLVKQLFFAATVATAEALRAKGLEVDHRTDRIWESPPGMVSKPWGFKPAISEEDLQALRDATNAVDQQAKAAREAGDHAAHLAHCHAAVMAEYEQQCAEMAPLQPVFCRLYCSHAGDLDTSYFWSQAEYEAHKAGLPIEDAQAREMASKPVALPHADIKLSNDTYAHGLHQLMTRIAGQALGRSLADNPMVALDTQISQQFQQCCLNLGNYAYDEGRSRLLRVSAGIKFDSISHPDEALQLPILERLKSYKQAYFESGLHPFEWIHDLPMTTKLDIFALITALQVNTTEDKNTITRSAARAEAAHVAQAIDHDIRNHWAPPEDLWPQYSKKQLLGFIDLMGLESKPYAKVGRADLAPKVAELAKEHNFVPPALNFELAAEDSTASTDDDEDDEGATTVAKVAQIVAAQKEVA